MGEIPQGLPTRAQEIRHRAIGLARVLAIPSDSFTARERQAYLVMSHLAAMPTIGDHARRRAYGNEILQNSNQLLPIDQPQNGQFSAHLRSHVIMMQEFPAWYSTLTKSSEELVNDYKLLKLMTWAMKNIGMGGLPGFGGAAVKGGIKGAQGAVAGGARAASAAGARGAMTGALGSVTGGLAGGLMIAWVIGSVAYVTLEARLKELGDAITQRYQEQRLSEDQYQECFGKDVALPQHYFYLVR